MKLNVLISTINEGIDKVADVILPPRDDVSYIVSHQYTDEKFQHYIPAKLKRPDVRVSHMRGSGVAKSRNNAIELAVGDIGLFSDDDVRYRQSDFDTILKTFQVHPHTDVAIFKIRTPDNEPEYRAYHTHIVEYKKAPEVGTVQLAFNIKRVKEQHIGFDERFGAGQPLLICNDERIFLHDCITAGLRVIYYPEYVVQHPYESTIKSISKYDIRKNWTTGGVDCRLNGSIALLKAFLGTFKNFKNLLQHQVNPARYCYQRLSAAIFILKTNKKNRTKRRYPRVNTNEDSIWNLEKEY